MGGGSVVCGDAWPEGFTHLACAVSHKRPASLLVLESGGSLLVRSGGALVLVPMTGLWPVTGFYQQPPAVSRATASAPTPNLLQPPS